MKKSLLAISVLLASSSMVASEYFVGIEAGNSSMTASASVANASISAKTDGGHKGIKFGTYIDNHRFTATLFSFNEASSVDVEEYSLAYDYMFEKTDKLTPFIGINVAKLTYKESGLQALSNNFNKDSIELSGTQVALNIGTTYELSKESEIEFGYRFPLSENGSDSVTYSGTNINIEIDDYKQWYVGYNYKF